MMLRLYSRTASPPTESDMSDETLRNRIADRWHRIREHWWARWGIDIAIFAAIFFAITWYQSRNLVDTGQVVPEMQLATVDGGTEPLADPEADRTMVYVWAPWCGVCTAETGTVNWAKSLLGDGVAVRSVVLDYRSPEAARRSAVEKGAEFPVLLGDEQVRQTLHVEAFPTFYWLSNDGRVLGSSRGYTTTAGLLWRSWF